MVNTYGYVGGVRLDSIDARYAQFSRRFLSDAVEFDYGQTKGKRKDLLITDSEGHQLMFDPYNIPFILNFFHFNGWELGHAYSIPGSDKEGVDKYILKKMQ